MYAYLISGDNKKLSVLELLSLSKENRFILDKRIVLISKPVDFRRICYTKKSYRLIGVFDYKDNLEKSITKININKFYKKNFSVRKVVLTSKYVPSEKDLSSIIWRRLSKPRVNLDNPSTKFEFVFTDKKIYLLLLLFEQDKKNMLSRWPQNRPAFHPTTMTPLFALMLVNLSGAKKANTLMDPFCGVGGIIIEAGLIGCKVIGYDKDTKMIIRARKNLEYFKIKNYYLEQRDALDVTKKADFIVTDVPYGRHSKLFGEETKNLASAFLARAINVLNKDGRVILVCPHNMKIDFRDFDIFDYVDYYIHSTLTRRIYILEKRKQRREYKSK